MTLRLMPLMLGLAVACSLVAASPAAAQEEKPAGSFAERLSKFRFGWRDSADAGPRRIASKQAVRVAPSGSLAHGATEQSAPLPKSDPIAPAPTSSSYRSRLPSLDPRRLLPGDLFGDSDGAAKSATSDQAARQAQSPAVRPRKRSVSGPWNNGSARARMMRDLRQQKPEQEIAPTRSVATTGRAVTGASRTLADAARSVAAPESKTRSAKRKATPLASSRPETDASAPRRPPARAGSILSGNAATTSPPPRSERYGAGDSGQPPVATKVDTKNDRYALPTTPKQSRPERRSFNKSLAAEIAREMAAQVEAAAGNEKLVESEAVSNVVKPAVKPAEKPEPVAKATLQANASSKPSNPQPELSPGRTTQGNRYGSMAADSDPELNTDDGAEDSSARAAFADSLSNEKEIAQTPTIQLKRIEPLASPAGQTEGSAFGSAFAGRDARARDLLMMGQTPMIASRVNGPRSIVVGRKATYSVVLANVGQAGAEGLEARILAPAWADVVTTRATRGAIKRDPSSETPGLIVWQLGDFSSKETATLDLTLIARQGTPIELAVDWRHDPVGGKTVVEVQEPKLEMAISGPDELLFGKPQRYRLRLSNPGTGVAEGVAVSLLPPGKSTAQASRHMVGDIKPGQSKILEMEFTPRQDGELAILANATAQGDLAAKTKKQVLCLKPGLEVDWRGPAQKYSGSAATYYFRVRNPGTAVAENVVFTVDLPADFELEATSRGQTYAAATRTLSWSVGSLRPGDDRYLQIRGVANGAGLQKFPLAAVTGDGLASHRDAAITEVVAMADLKLDIVDPRGPLPTGKEVVYEVHVKNRGAVAAEQVSIVALFSDGIEPTAVNGTRYRATDGRVAIDTIGKLAAGAEKVIKITAQAQRAGTHIFRAEVLCRDLELKLAAEEMTKFYVEETLDLGGGSQSVGQLDRFVYPW